MPLLVCWVFLSLPLALRGALFGSWWSVLPLLETLWAAPTLLLWLCDIQTSVTAVTEGLPLTVIQGVPSGDQIPAV